jgi:hypothetical protein
MYFFDNKVAFKPRPKGIIPGEGIKSKPSVQDFDIPENEGDVNTQVYKFNVASGFPPSIENGANKLIDHLSGKPINYSHPHVVEQAAKKNIDLENLPHFGTFPGREHGFSPVEIEIGKNPNGQSRVSKLVMRGPLDDQRDVSIPIQINPSGKPLARTIWPNNKFDVHHTLDMRRYHLPEEFAHGTLPTRILNTDKEARMPGYRPLLHNNQAARDAILAKHGRNK